LNITEEEALVHRCQMGDKEAFRTLVNEHKRALFGTALLMTQDYGTAEDAVQETLIKSWQKIAQLRLKGRLKAWLLRILVNEVKQQYRKKRVPTIPLESTDVAEGISIEAESPLIRHEDHQSLRIALDSLPPEQREAIVLHYFTDLKVPEIARITGQRQGTIKSRLSRALDRLEALLKEDDLRGERR
jgi:RNA polymerase sigma-70 factor (ECF subfamily)